MYISHPSPLIPSIKIRKRKRKKKTPQVLHRKYGDQNQARKRERRRERQRERENSRVAAMSKDLSFGSTSNDLINSSPSLYHDSSGIAEKHIKVPKQIFRPDAKKLHDSLQHSRVNTTKLPLNPIADMQIRLSGSASNALWVIGFSPLAVGQ